MLTRPPVGIELLARIRDENLNVYRASPQRLREDVGQENQIAQDYRGRLIYELLQNADDAMASGDTGMACIRFVLTDDALWVGNSGRPLDEADVRGLCGISASSKVTSGRKRRATIGHKGMGFKSVLEITDAPEVYSTTISFRFGPKEALQTVQALVEDGIVAPVSRAPVARFPWSVEGAPEVWKAMRADGLQTAFRFPLRNQVIAEQRAWLADALINLPVTTLVFLKHFRRIECIVQQDGKRREMAWSVMRERLSSGCEQEPSGGLKTGVYRIVLRPDVGETEAFLLSHDNDIVIGDHRGGLDEFSWEGVEYSEASVAARLKGGRPVPLVPEWRKLHVFLPSGEPCPYDLLISGAFNSNLSRQEIRVEPDGRNYNRFLLGQAARLVRDDLVPTLLQQGAAAGEVLRLLDRRVKPGVAAGTATAQALYEEVKSKIQHLALAPSESGLTLALKDCVVPPLVDDDQVGCDFRAVLPENATFGDQAFPIAELCGSDTARILVDHGARVLTATEAATVLAQADPERSRARDDLERGVMVDPVLSILERIWRGLDIFAKAQFVAAIRRRPLCPVNVDDRHAVHRIAIDSLECFYPPRSLSGEVPLDGLCFLARDLCWGALTPKERNVALRHQMEAWQALFEVREFKFPDVMRASVLPALDLEQSAQSQRTREGLRDLARLAAICQLAGRMPNRSAPLPYERLGPNRALFNLSRLDVPCRGTIDNQVRWVPAYRAYFGENWVGESSIEWVLLAGESVGAAMPDVDILLGPSEFAGLLDRYRHLKGAATADDSEIGEDEVSIDEDEETALDADDRTRWFEFFSWIGVNSALRPVHFHDVEDRASGWLRTEGLRRPEGWAFQKILPADWERFVDGVRQALQRDEAGRSESAVPYFYRLHDLEHLVMLLEAAAHDESAQLGRALYEHLARNWSTLERRARLQVALVPKGKSPGMRTKPPRAYDDELVEVGDDYWVRRLQEAWFCPTEHGPRPASQIWPPTMEVQRRFGYRMRASTWRYLVPTLTVDDSLNRGRARTFAQVLGMREELTPAGFTLDDARGVLERLQALFSQQADAGADLRSELREVIRPAYRSLLELLSNRERPDQSRYSARPALVDSPVLAQDGTGALRFARASEVFYADRRETRDRLASDEGIWTFVIEAWQGARAPLAQAFGMRTLEDSLTWVPAPGEASLCQDDIGRFRQGLRDLAPYLLARIGADRVDDRQDARRLRRFIEIVEPVSHLALGCSLEGRSLAVATDQRSAYVEIREDAPTLALVVWGEHPWPPADEEAEALAMALCELHGANYFEPFLALIQAGSAPARERLLRRAGAPHDVDEKRALLLGEAASDDVTAAANELEIRTAAPTVSSEEPAQAPEPTAGGGVSTQPAPRTPLLAPDEILIGGEPVRLVGPGALPPVQSRRQHERVMPSQPAGNHLAGYGGHTDLDMLNRVGMSVALAYERNRLTKTGLDAQIFDGPSLVDSSEALIFDVSSPALIDQARSCSPRFDAVIRRLQSEFGLSLEWPGFDILTLDLRKDTQFDRLIELKSSGVDARIQEMSWNEWKVAGGSLRQHFFLYLVGNLRADIEGAMPFVRTVQDPFGQLAAEVRVSQATQRKVHLAVRQFREAEHLNLTVIREGDRIVDSRKLA